MRRRWPSTPAPAAARCWPPWTRPDRPRLTASRRRRIVGRRPRKMSPMAARRCIAGRNLRSSTLGLDQAGGAAGRTGATPAAHPCSRLPTLSLMTCRSRLRPHLPRAAGTPEDRARGWAACSFLPSTGAVPAVAATHSSCLIAAFRALGPVQHDQHFCVARLSGPAQGARADDCG